MTQSDQNNINIDYQLRYAHIDGHTELDFIKKHGECEIITSGVDCEIRTWSLLPDSDSVISTYTVEDVPYSVIARKDQVFVALANNMVKSFQLEELGDEEKVVTRFASNVTCLSLNIDQELLAIGAGDFQIKILDLADPIKPKVLEGHQGPVLSVSLDPLRKYLASSSCDGSVLLWSIETKSVLFHWPKQLPKSNDFDNSPTLCRMAWEPRFGEFLALPDPESSVQIYKRGVWDSPAHKLQHAQFIGLVSIICFSSDGQLMATASSVDKSSVIAVWRVESIMNSAAQSNNPIAVMYNGENRITCLKFNPNKPEQLCSADNSGCLKILNIKNLSTSVAASKNMVKTSMDIKQPQPIISQKTVDDVLEDFEMNDSDLDDLSFIKQDANKKSDNTKVSNPMNDRFADLPDDDLKPTEDFMNPPSIPTAEPNLADDPDLDPEEFDIGAIKSKYEPLIFGDENDDSKFLGSTAGSMIPTKMSANTELIIDGQRITGGDLLSLIRAPKYQPPHRQPAFQSGSTPIHYQNRFMVWNSVGIVYSYNREDEHSIDVEFHDLTFHHSIHMVNMFNYTMADLSTSCLLLASNGDDMSYDEMDRHRARLFCQQFNSWDQVKEWQIDLQSDGSQEERFECITAGQSFVAALTSLRYLRVWTIGGVQTMIRSIDGPAINLSSYDQYLMAMYYQTETSQSVHCFALKVDHRGKTRAHPIPEPVQVALTPKSTVYWAGFSDEGTPCVMDSDGIIQLYKNHFGTGWFPVCATKRQANGRSDNFFLIGLSEIQSQIRCIYCKASRYPDTVPKPTLTILPLQIPLCESSSNKSKHEEECLRNRWLVSLLKRLSLDGYDVEDALDQADKQIINSLIKLFALALGAERESLALEVAKLLPNSQSLEGAIRYAERQRHRSLAMKLVEMIQEGGPEQENENNEDRDSDDELQELMTKKQRDRLRQLVKNDDDDNGYQTISLTKYQQGNKTDNFTTIKPKPLNSKREPLSPINLDNEEEEPDDNDENDDLELHPKPLTKMVKNGRKNPFKVEQNKKRKLTSDDENEDDDIDLRNHRNNNDEDSRSDLVEMDDQDDNDQDDQQPKSKSTNNKKRREKTSKTSELEQPTTGNNNNKITNFFTKKLTT